MIGNEAQVIVDGQIVNVNMTPKDPLVRAAIISLFSWRRASDGDVAVGDEKFGWWGDSFATSKEAKIGSRLWLLARQKMVFDTYAKAKEYTAEALQWMIDDGVASGIIVTAMRNGVDRLDLRILIARGDGSTLDLRFADLWGSLNV